jgi:hypothetical protein
VETDRDVEDFLENHLEGVCFAEFCNAIAGPLDVATARDRYVRVGAKRKRLPLPTIPVAIVPVTTDSYREVERARSL